MSKITVVATDEKFNTFDTKMKLYICKYVKSRLNPYIEKMPEGEFLNLHNDKIEKARGIALLVNGDVCPLFDTLHCMNTLRISKHPKQDETPEVALSTYSINAPNFIYDAQSMEAAVMRYNEACFKCEANGKYIMAFYEF